MAQQNFTLEDYLHDLGLVSRVVDISDSTNKYNKQKNKPGADLTKVYHDLGQLVAGDKDTFVNATDSGILGPIADMQERFKPRVEEIVNRYKDRIFEGYVKIQEVIVKGIKEGIKEQISKNKNFKELSEDEKKVELDKNIKLNLYAGMGKLVRQMPLTEEYAKANPEFADYIQKIENLESLTDEGNALELKNEMVNAKGLPSSFALLPVANKWSSRSGVAEQIGIYERIIGKKFITDDNKLNVEELKKYTKGNTEAYKKMANVVYKTLTQQGG